jgi:hypothetical protein
MTPSHTSSIKHTLSPKQVGLQHKEKKSKISNLLQRKKRANPNTTNHQMQHQEIYFQLIPRQQRINVISTSQITTRNIKKANSSISTSPEKMTSSGGGTSTMYDEAACRTTLSFIQQG